MCLALIVTSASLAHANSYTWTFNGGLGGNGSGTLTTDGPGTGLNGPGFVIDQITGTWSSNDATGGTGNLPIPITNLLPAGFLLNNNILYPNSPFLDLDGVGFAADGFLVTLSFSISGTFYESFTREPTGRHIFGEGDFIVTPVSAVPLPAALPLFASGLVGLGWLARRRRRQTA
jgi:hypothetical protein